MISKSFLKSSFIYTIGGALPMASSIVLLPFYTNLLSEKNYVAVLFYISISMLFQILFSFSIESYFGVKYSQLSNNHEAQKKFTGTISNLLLYIGIGLLVISLVFGPLLFSLVFKGAENISFWPNGFLSILTAFFNSYYKTCTNSFIFFKLPNKFLSFNLINFFSTIAISILGLYIFPGTIDGPIYGRFLSGALIFVMSFLEFRRHSEPVFEKSYLKEIAGFCFPYVLFVLSMWVLGNIDRFALNLKVQSSSLASYDILLKCFLGIEFIQNGLSAVIYPKLYEIWHKTKRMETTPETNRYFNVFTAINIIILIAFCIIIPLGLKLFINKPEYYEGFNYIGLVAAGCANRTIINYYIVTILFSKKTWLLVMIFGISSVCQIILTYTMAPVWGLLGAVYAGLITKCIQILLSAVCTKKIFVYKFNWVKIYLLPLLYIFSNILIYHISNTYSVYPYICLLAFFSLVLYLIFKNEIISVSNQFIKKK